MVHPGIVAGATVTPPTVAHVPGWTSLGCYLDNLAPYQLLSANTTSKLMTPQVCETFCAAFKYFGLENGDFIDPLTYPLTNSYRWNLLLRRQAQYRAMRISLLAIILRRYTCLSHGM
jgi:hypothetical protein